MFCLALYPKVGLLGHMVTRVLIVRGTALLFPTNGARGLWFLHMLASIAPSCFLESSHPHGRGVVITFTC